MRKKYGAGRLRLRTELRKGGGGKGSTPDYRGAAEEQAESSQQNTTAQTWANRPTMNTPWGSQTWNPEVNYDPGTGQRVTAWDSTISLAPEQQAALDAQMGIQQGRSEAAGTLLGQATGAFDTPFDWDNLTEQASLEDMGYDPTQARDRAEQALFQRQMNMIEPQLTQSEEARRARMSAMGIPLEGGSEAFRRAQEGMDANRQRATEQAALASIAGGGQEAGRELGLASGAADFQNQLRQREIAEQAQRRGMPLNELNALLTGQQVGLPDMSQGQPASTANRADTTNYLNAAQMQGEFDLANQTDYGSMLGTAAQGAFMFSDRRLKKNIKPLGDGWYEYEYIWGGPRQVGVMAQENPHAAHTDPSGFLMVDYGRL